MSEKPTGWKNKLYFGDNLHILSDHFADESVDFIYLDPPFNSNATYNVLFGEKNGSQSQAQITAFDDTWHWGEDSEKTYRELVTEGPRKLADLVQALRNFLGQNDMMAYLTMMAARLAELHRVLKSTGSIYLHCDTTASHYIKLLLDAVFSFKNYRSEIIWKRSASHGGATNYHDIHDILFYYHKGGKPTWNPQYKPHDAEYIKTHYTQKDNDGRLYQLVSAHGPGQGPPRKFGDIILEPPPGRHWMEQDTIDRWLTEERLVFTKSGRPRYKRFLDDTPGQPPSTVWTDIPPINSQAKERLGYPTQKPEALLERILRSSSNEGDLILDPFCGCGTTINVAERLNRRWIGIDITHLAIALIKNRLHDTFGPELLPYDVIGAPRDLSSAKALAEQDRYQFEWWTLSLVDARPAQDKKKGADSGMDGFINFFDDTSGNAKKIIVQVKSGHVTATQIRDLKAVVDREKAVIGAFLTLTSPTKPMKEEALTAGHYIPEHLPKEHQAPKIQILTISELLSGGRLKYPRLAVATFKKAARKYKASGPSQDNCFDDNDLL